MSDTIRLRLFPLRSMFAPDYVRIIGAVIADIYRIKVSQKQFV